MVVVGRVQALGMAAVLGRVQAVAKVLEMAQETVLAMALQQPAGDKEVRGW